MLPKYLRFWQTYCTESMLVLERLCTTEWYSQTSLAATEKGLRLSTDVLMCTGMNLFLKNLDITFRRDPTNYRPRINKMHSVKDQEQKSAGSYYYLDD